MGAPVACNCLAAKARRLFFAYFLTLIPVEVLNKRRV